MRHYIMIRSPYDFPAIRVLAVWTGTFWTISRRSYRRIPRGQGFRMVARPPAPYDAVHPDAAPVVVEDR